MKPKPAAESDEKTLRYLKVAGVLLLLVAAGWFLVRSLQPDRPKVNTRPFKSLGGWAAEETSKFLNKSGKVLVLREVPASNMLATDPLRQVLEAQDAQVDEFKHRLEALGKFEIGSDFRLIRPGNSQYSVWPSGAMTKLLQTQPQNTTLVAFCSLPPFDSAEKTLLGQRSGKMVIVGGMVNESRGLVKAGLVHLALVYRLPVPPKTTENETPDQWVQRCFLTITAASSGMN